MMEISILFLFHIVQSTWFSLPSYYILMCRFYFVSGLFLTFISTYYQTKQSSQLFKDVLEQIIIGKSYLFPCSGYGRLARDISFHLNILSPLEKN